MQRTLWLTLLLMIFPLGAQEVDEASLEIRLAAFQEAFAPLVRNWESLTARGTHLNWEAGFFRALEGDQVVILSVPLVEVAEKARYGERLKALPVRDRQAPPPVVGLPLAKDVAFFTSSGRRLARESLKLPRDQLVALGRNPETGEVEIVVVLEEPTLERLGEQYGSNLQKFTARE